MKLFFAALAVFFAAPAVAVAAPSVVARNLSVQAGLVAQAPNTFDLVGLHWKGSGAIRFRTQRADGTWSRWQLSAPEVDDLPDRGTPEAKRSRGWHLGNPFWVGRSERIQYRFDGPVKKLRAFFVRSPLLRGTPQRLQAFTENAPPVITRAQWGANESIRRNKKKGPKIADNVQVAIVHHTAGTNNYSRSQSAAIVRGIELYHVLGNHWDDIGYNFLIDKYGQVFEGRYGGMTKAVVGAHALGFNSGSVGVALLGNYNNATLTSAARASLVALLAWRLDVAHLDPLSQVTRISTGNPEYSKGTPVALNAISGHRDTYPTSCPGTNLYAQLPSIRRQVAATGLPKIYSPIVIGGVGGNVRFTARLSSRLPWTVTVTDSLGRTVATGTGTGSAVDYTWDATLTPISSYSYTITAGGVGTAAARPATGLVGATLPTVFISQLKVDPSVVSPNGDGVGDAARITYILSESAPVTITLEDSGGHTLSTLSSGVADHGSHSFLWNRVTVPDGRYAIAVTAGSPTGKHVTSRVTVYVDRTVSQPKLSAPALSPNGDGRFDTTALSFRLNVGAQVRVELWRGSKLVGTVMTQTLGVGPAQVTWDGTLAGKRVADGSYQLVLKVKDTLTTVTQSFPVVVDTRPPRLRLASRSRLRFWTNEPATVTASFGSRRVVRRVRAGYFTLPFLRGARHFTLTATDSVGNTSVSRF
ncbi:MAG TPA: N-acetylmuramoyl-L-alanine amidase [Gaiellaceae bacterium]|nr:N-acetylmuramoyl-L-alanine amidase [Gaiellaceae bacterium]